VTDNLVAQGVPKLLGVCVIFAHKTETQSCEHRRKSYPRHIMFHHGKITATRDVWKTEIRFGFSF